MNDDQQKSPRVPDARETLISREQIRGASRMIAEGTDASTVSDEQVRMVADDVELFSRRHNLSRKQIARAIGYDSPGVISEFVAGKYKGNSKQLAIDLDAWLDEEEKRRSRPKTTSFVWTNVAVEIKSCAEYCLDLRKIGLIYGPDTTGIGKTTALKAIHQAFGPRRSSLVTIDEVDGNPTGLLKRICQAIHIDDKGSSSQRFDRIRAKLSGRSHLLMIDQIQNLRNAKDDKPLYILADLHDALEDSCGQLWCGTADMIVYLERQQSRKSDESLSQIRRRICPRVDLMEPLRKGGPGGGTLLVTVEQVREMFGKNKLKLTAAASRFLCELCNQPDSGAVGLCVQIVEYATMMAEMTRDVTSIDVPLLKSAMRRCFAPKRTDGLLLLVDEQQRYLTKVG